MALPRAAALLAGALVRVWRLIWRHPVLLGAALPLAAILYVALQVPLTPGIDHIRKAKAAQPSVLLSADGQVLATFQDTHREWVRLPDISKHVVDALVATEDRRFFEHHGLDLRRTVSAAVHTLRGDLQGGSTITQQLARNLYPDEIGRAPTLARKVKEAITAVKIESVYSKDEILESYLNTVPFLYNAYGIEMAARTYFDKSADELDVLESATLVGMLKGTSYYNPVVNPQRAQQRRNTVLAQMVRAGKLEPAQFEALRGKPLKLDFERQTESPGPAPHLAQQLRRWLIEWADRRGYDINADGLVVVTTIDARLQNLANQALARQSDKLQAIADRVWGKGASSKANKDLVDAFLRESEPYRTLRSAGASDAEALRKVAADAELMQSLWREKTRLQSGFMALDPTNGHIKAWVGSRDFEQEKFDHVQQARRQPGSTFKPFVYGAAFEEGISPSETFMDEPVEIRVDARTVWRPTDVEPPSGQPMTLRDGLIHSKNTITSQLMQRIGPERVGRTAYLMGVRHSKLDLVPSLALGTSPVTLKEMVSAFGSIANGGNYIEPVLVARVEDRQHRVIEDFGVRLPEAAMAGAAAQTLLDVMRGVIDKGTGAGIRQRFGIQGDVAGKTGTTQENTDGWFILMHPQLVAGAWVGFNDNRITMKGDWGQGAHNALNIVGDFFQQTLKARFIDANARFAAPHQENSTDPTLGRVNDSWNGVVPPAPATAVVPEPAPPSQPADAQALPVTAPAPQPANPPLRIIVPRNPPPENRSGPWVILAPEVSPREPNAPMPTTVVREGAVTLVPGAGSLAIPRDGSRGDEGTFR